MNFIQNSYLRNVSVKTKYGRPNLEFNPDGTLKYVELDIMNLNNIGIWDKVSSIIPIANWQLALIVCFLN